MHHPCCCQVSRGLWLCLKPRKCNLYNCISVKGAIFYCPEPITRQMS